MRENLRIRNNVFVSISINRDLYRAIENGER